MMAESPTQDNVYTVDEGVLVNRELERKIIRELAEACKPMDPSLGQLDASDRYARVMNFVEDLVRRRFPLWASDARRRLSVRTVDMLLRLGPLEPLLADRGVTDITANGIDDIWVDRGQGLEPSDLWFVDEQEFRTVTERLLKNVHRRLDEASPMVDARLDSGDRVNIVIPPASVDGLAMTIRRFPHPYTPEELAKEGTFDEPLLKLLAACVRARVNIVISGGAGSGKTTLLNALTTFIPEEERLVSIEDISELALFRRRRNVVAMETRPANVEGTGEITVRALVRNALRMRPDRIIVGEVRGPETLDMLQAMNTGHDGSITTVHANSSADAVPRLLTLAAMTELGLSFSALQAQVRSAVDIIVQLARGRDRTRRLVELAVVSPDEKRGVGLDIVSRLNDAPVGGGDRDYAHTALPPRLAERLAAAGEAFPDEFLPD